MGWEGTQKALLAWEAWIPERRERTWTQVFKIFESHFGSKS